MVFMRMISATAFVVIIVLVLLAFVEPWLGVVLTAKYWWLILPWLGSGIMTFHDE